jgi:YHS domain-containing protein
MFIRGFFRLMYYAIVAYIIFSVYRFLKNLGKPRRRPQEPARISGVMVKDEACQTYLPRSEALRDVVDGQEYFFCSKDCRQKFLDERKRGGRA